MRYSVCLCAVWLLGFCAAVCPAYAGDGDHLLPVAGTQWKGRKVAFMGDSITDKAHVGTTKNYWQYLQEMLGLVPFVYGINGQQWRARRRHRCDPDLCRDERFQFRDAPG